MHCWTAGGSHTSKYITMSHVLEAYFGKQHRVLAGNTPHVMHDMDIVIEVD